MATGSIPSTQFARAQRVASDVPFPLAVLRVLGSLKITVAMFALSIFIVLVGTLAQDDLDLAQVKRDYFTCWLAFVPFDVFAPTTLYEHSEPLLGGWGFYFPGGATIGLILLVNLIAAKTTRFSVQAKGMRLWIGWLVSALGLGLVIAVIMSGHIADGLQGSPPIGYDSLWTLLKGGMVLLTIALVAYAVMAKKLAPLARNLVVAATVVAFALTVLLLTGGDSVRLDDPGLRIVWQLLQATVASSVVLAGLWMVFGRRGGNVLIHAGVGLLMVGQFVFGDRQVEQRMGLIEGESTNLVVLEDSVEIALIDVSDPKEDMVYAIHEPMIIKFAGSDQSIDDSQLPCKVKVIDWMKNSRIVPLGAGDEDNPATTGLGLMEKAVEEPPVGGAMQDRNVAAAYVQLLDKDSGAPIATLLLAQERNDFTKVFGPVADDEPERVEINGRPFEVGLRYRQLRKPYDVQLKDVERINYSGSETPRDYSSRIVITDRDSGVSQEGKTWMNNPIRYRGETFYQSRYNQLPRAGQIVESTGLQIVKNSGWVIPYVSCMMVFVGMFAHFGGTFTVFASRYARGAIPGSSLRDSVSGGLLGRSLIAVVALGLCAAITGRFAATPTFSRTEVDTVALGRLPMQHEGRIKPFDTVARNTLQVIAKPMFGLTPRLEDDKGRQRSASEWLLSVMAGEAWVLDTEIFRLYASEVRDIFDLDPRKGYRYSYNELEPNMDKFRAEIGKLRGKNPDDFTIYEQRLASAYRQIDLFEKIGYAYSVPPIPDPSRFEDGFEYLKSLSETSRMVQQLRESRLPALLPPTGEATKENLVDAEWEVFSAAAFGTVARRGGVAETLEMGGLKVPPASDLVLPVNDILEAVRSDDVDELNSKIKAYAALVEDMPLAAGFLDKTAAESWLNRYNPTLQGVALYIVAIVLGLGSVLVKMLNGHDGIRKATFWLLVGVFLIHTIALIARVYVSGRAPVINLYSSAVYIGWACVLFGLVLEWIYPIGVGNLVAGLIGASTLSVARFLDTEDTLHVLQAVLDTQFWLSTHVLTVTAGYAVTFLAGFIGIVALVHRIVVGLDSFPKDKQPVEAVQLQQILYRMTYGIICFAIFFSFIGTVLGGLWADDSWGRFWGWDPKENGALMIVLWNALILHSRWDKQVGMRGFAILAVLGNVVTAWSWFGTNQLGIGLHSYGFTNGALVTLIVFALANLGFVAVALVITRSMALGARRGNSGT